MIEEETELLISKLLEKIDEVKKSLEKAASSSRKLLEQKGRIIEKLAELAMQLQITSKVKMQFLEAFLKKPYAVFETSKPGEYVLAVPRFIDFPLGYLEKIDESYNYFRVNKYIDWIIELPEALKQQLGIRPPPFPAKLEGLALITTPEHEQQVSEALGEYLIRKIEPGKFQIHPKKYFELIASLVKLGIMPFTPQPIDNEDMKPNVSDIKFWPWQERAWHIFKKYSHIGIFFPYGTGKTYFAAWVLGAMKGPHLIVVPNRTLVETWGKYLERFNVPKTDYEIITYQSVKKILKEKKKYKVVVFDECHHIPADVFSLGALIPRRYTIGLSGSPFREDGREYYIFALTGKPVGLTWDEILKLGVVKKPTVHVYIVKSWSDKVYLTESLLSTAKPKTLIYCDSIARGKQLASRFGVQFIYGETVNRLELIEKSDIAVISRVGDEGIDIKKLRTIIEVDFLGASRRQESQRLGRLFHSQFKGEHHVIMTEDEYARFKKRLYPLVERGLEVVVHTAGGTLTLGPAEAKTPKNAYKVAKKPRIKQSPTILPQQAPQLEPPDTDTQVTPYIQGVQKIISRLPTPQKKLMEFLLQNRERYFSSEELALALGYSNAKNFRKSTKPGTLARYPFFKIKKQGRKTLYGISLPSENNNQ